MMNNSEKYNQCWWRSKILALCQRKENWKVFYKEHKRQFRIWLFSIISILGAVSSVVTIYQCMFDSPKSHTTINNVIEIKEIIQPIPDNYINRAILGIAEFDSKYKRGISYLKAKNYEKAVDMFSEIYGIKPDYPTLALHYGQALVMSNRNDEALAVWLSVPSSEKYSFLNYNIAATYKELKKYVDALKYFNLSLNDLNRNDCRYWSARANIIALSDRESSINKLIFDINEFVEIINNDIRNLSRYEVKEGTKYERNKEQVMSDILSRQVAAFWLLWVGSYKLSCDQKDYNSSLKLAIRAAAFLPKPVVGCSIVIDKAGYLEFLYHLSIVLKYSNNQTEFYKEINEIMPKIEKCNANDHQEIADYAMLIQSFYGDGNEIKSLKRGKFELTYECNIKDDRGLKRISIYSPDYLLGEKRLDIHGEKEYLYGEKIEISPNNKIKIKPYFKLITEDTSGNISNMNLYPLIKLIR